MLDETNRAGAISDPKSKHLLSDNHCSSLEESEDDDSDPMNMNDSSMEDGCLHCQQHSLQVQVRCDECSAYICSHCHWCHEFQANHEIRVCDRCDAFYCRACDEMDQCDDCGEVVCGTCSTLLSCKFCGGGLCEDCATACGRCGIVLCNRDAKFAVDCDTCRLSYCLVCLASGNKDPCVRCGHRPSKRMEQLVHLRLKSIYKAFKTTTTSNSNTLAANSNQHYNTNGGNNTHALSHNNMHTTPRRNHSHHHSTRQTSTGGSNNTQMRQNDNHTTDEFNPGALMLAAAASAAAPTAQLAAAAAAAASIASATPNPQVGTAAACCVNNNQISNTTADQRLTARASAEMYEAERIKAEQAAAALLAELEEEELAVKTKKSKKKKKKEKQQAKKAIKKQIEKGEEEEDAAVEDEEEKHSPPPVIPFPGKPRRVENDSGQQQLQLHVESTIDATKAAASAISISKKEDKPVGLFGPTEVDPLESEYEALLFNQDIEGLEELLSSIKGVVGKAMLRKNVKKALKRLRFVEEEPDEEALLSEAGLSAVPDVEADPSNSSKRSSLLPPSTPMAPPPTLATSQHPSPDNNNVQSHVGTVTPMAQSPRVAELLTIVSQNHNKVSSNSRMPKGNPGTPKSECIMHMAPLIVGWVIGKGGQRIRDLMEESGARIWIDQDSMAQNEPRIVYVSGHRSNVEAAVRMITDLIAKAPTDTPNSKSTPSNVLDPRQTTNAPPNLNFAKIPGLPIHMAGGESSAFQLKPREKKKNGDAKAWREMTCDARFVPLLIGRRGWTIKNIQDSSGARVDIDQHVTPRKITISGNEAAVEIAARMVGDVLSYPHSLLHGASDDMDIFQSGEPMLDLPADLDIVADLDEEEDPASLDRPSSPLDAQEKSRLHPSPPSSLIMAVDGKSTMSATSSLSSTPEPLVPTNTASFPQVATLLQPAFELPAAHSHEILPNTFTGFPEVPIIASSARNSLPGGLLAQDAVGLGFGHDPVFLHNGIHGLGTTSMPSLPHSLDRGPSNYEQAPPLRAFSSGPDSRGKPIPVPHQSRFHGGPSLLATGENHPRSLGNPPIQASKPQPSSVLPSVWDSSNGRDGFGLAAAVDFLQHHNKESMVNARPRTSVLQPGMNELIGLPNPSSPGPEVLGGLGLRQAGVQPLLGGVGKDESNIVDSLFSSTPDPRHDVALVSSLRGLSLDLQNNNGSDLWGSAGFDLPPLGTSSLGAISLEQQPCNVSNPVMGSSLFSTIDVNDRQHSRFSWGESD